MSVLEKISMIETAIQKYGEIFACGKCKTLDDCFRTHPIYDKSIFYFNDKNSSTHVVIK
jgi:hypothetical protein